MSNNRQILFLQILWNFEKKDKCIARWRTLLHLYCLLIQSKLDYNAVVYGSIRKLTFIC